MTYHTLKCPHCNRVLGSGSGSPSYIGNPIHQCPFCGGIYTDPFTVEWINKSPVSRLFFYAGKPLGFGFLSIILIAGFLTMVGVHILVALFTAIGLSVIIALLIFFVRLEGIKEKIKESFERTKHANYVEQLKKAGYTFYPIEGVEVGTIKDEEPENKTDGKDIKEVKDKTITLH